MTRKLAYLIIVIALASPLAFAEDKKVDTTTSKDSTEKTTEEKSANTGKKDSGDQNEVANDSPLVRAAKSSSKDRPKAKISITNKDLENIKGTLIETSSKPLQPLPPARDVEAALRDTPSSATKGAKKSKAEVATLQKEVDDLENELRRIEETYYTEDDPDFREEVIAMRFEETKKQLDAARKELAKARRGASSK